MSTTTPPEPGTPSTPGMDGTPGGAPNTSGGPSTGLRGLAARHPLAAFLVPALIIGWVAVGVPAALGVDYSPFLLVVVFLGLLAPALLVTRVVDGPSGVRRLLSRAVQWRFSPLRWAVVLLGVPVLTLAFAAASGTLISPEDGWPTMAGWYLFNTLIFGALILNVWEETAWAGFVQTRFQAQRGFLAGVLFTAAFFAAIHLPLYAADAGSWSELGVNLAVLFGLVPVYRWLIGMHLLDTRGSVLAAGVQHASWNASGDLEAVDGAWQPMAAVVLLTVLVALARTASRRRSGAVGGDADRLAAAAWLGHARAPVE